LCGSDLGAGYDDRGDSVAGHVVHAEADNGADVSRVTTAAGADVSISGGYGVAGTIESDGGVGVVARTPRGIRICGNSTIGGSTAVGRNTAIASHISIGDDTTKGGDARCRRRSQRRHTFSGRQPNRWR
jgi:hypothetical protein